MFSLLHGKIYDMNGILRDETMAEQQRTDKNGQTRDRGLLIKSAVKTS